jgi:hypothetical protein
MSPLPSGFLPGVNGLDSVEKMLYYAILKIHQAGNNANVFVDETSISSTRAVQIYPLAVQNQPQPWTIITRLSLSIPNNWAGLATRLWAQVSPLGGNTNIPSSFQTPSALSLTTWERLAAWCALALQGTFPDATAPETPSIRQAIATPFSVDFSIVRSWRLILRVSCLATPNWPIVQLWEAIQPIGNTAINSAFL